MKKKLLAIVVTLVLMLGSTVTVYAGPYGGVAPPPRPKTLSLCIMELSLDLSVTYDPGQKEVLFTAY